MTGGPQTPFQTIGRSCAGWMAAPAEVNNPSCFCIERLGTHGGHMCCAQPVRAQTPGSSSIVVTPGGASCDMFAAGACAIHVMRVDNEGMEACTPAMVSWT